MRLLIETDNHDPYLAPSDALDLPGATAVQTPDRDISGLLCSEHPPCPRTTVLADVRGEDRVRYLRSICTLVPRDMIGVLRGVYARWICRRALTSRQR